MFDTADISAQIERDNARRDAIAAAAQTASLEVAAQNGPDKGFCELSYIVGAMQEAEMAFERNG